MAKTTINIITVTLWPDETPLSVFRGIPEEGEIVLMKSAKKGGWSEAILYRYGWVRLNGGESPIDLSPGDMWFWPPKMEGRDHG